MSQALPADLINPSVVELNRASDDNVRFTSSEVLHRFWKVYEAQSNYVNDSSISRLRNLFWRIWSSDSLAGSISNEKLNQLWLRCRREDPIAPIQLPRGFYKRYGTGDIHGPIHPNERIHPTRSTGEAGLASRSVREQSGRTQIGQGDSNTTSTGSSECSSRPALRRNTSGGKNRPLVVASGARGRAKPALLRRKSSQSRTQQPNPARLPQPALRSPTARTGTEEGAGGAPAAHAPAWKEPAFTLPSASSWQSVDESSPRQSSPIAERQEGQIGSLVDRDFRSKFLSSATNLPALGRMRKTGSVVRFADEEDEAGKGKETALSPPSSPEKLRSRGRTASQVIDSDDSDESDKVQLPRTQSQLSMAIKDRRKLSGSRDLGPEPVGKAEPEKKSESKRREEELLKMGRQAGAPHIPKGRRGSGEDAGYRSPSPGPTF